MRTIYLLRNGAGGWFIRTASSSGDKIHVQESFASASNAQRAFIVEGRHQPFARMAVVVDDRTPLVVVRPATRLPTANARAEATLVWAVRDALKARARH